MVGGYARLLPLLLGISTTRQSSISCHQLTYPMVFTQAYQSEAHRDHSSVHCERDSFACVLDLATRGFGQARRHEGGEGRCAERAARGVWRNHIFWCSEADYVYESIADVVLA